MQAAFEASKYKKFNKKMFLTVWPRQGWQIKFDPKWLQSMERAEYVNWFDDLDPSVGSL